MQTFKIFTYWFVGINIVVSALFMLLACIFGGRDLLQLLRDLHHGDVDETDDGRVEHFQQK